MSFARGALLTGELASVCAVVDAMMHNMDVVLNVGPMQGQGHPRAAADKSWVCNAQRSFALQDLEQVCRLLEALIVPMVVDKGDVDDDVNLNE